MRYLLSIIALATMLSADDFTFDNEFEWQAGRYERGTQTSETDRNTLSLMTYTPIINYKYEKVSFNFIPMFTLLKSDKPVFNSITGEEYEKSDFFVKSMYIKYNAGKHKFLVGILPFSYNGYLGYKNDYYERGEGLHTILDKDILGLMYIYEYSDTLTFKLAYGGSYFNRDTIPTGDYDNHLEKDLILITNYKEGKIRIDTNLLYQDCYTEDGVYNMGDFTALGVGFVYDDSEHSGLSVYNVISGSYQNFKGISGDYVRKHSGTNITDEEIKADPSYLTDPSKETGWSNLLGARKDIDIKGEEFYINLEWYHVEGNFISANLGNIYKGDATDMFYVADDSYSATFGYLINDSQYIKYVYSYVGFDSLPAMGNRAVRVPTELHKGDTTSYTYMKLLWNYKF